MISPVESKALIEKFASSDLAHPNHAGYDRMMDGNYAWIFNQIPFVSPERKIKAWDIGCAYGTTAAYLAAWGYITTASDIVDTYVNIPMLKHFGVEFKLDNIETGLAPSVDYDVIVFTEVLEHLNQNPRSALLNISRALKHGGRLVLTTPRAEMAYHPLGLYQDTAYGDIQPIANYDHWQSIPAEPLTAQWLDAHVYLYTESEIIELLEATNFRILKSEVCNQISHGVVAYKP